MQSAAIIRLAALALAVAPSASLMPSFVVLRNAADEGVVNAISGLGTAGGGTDHGYGVWPECWASCFDAQCLQPNPNGCANNTERAIAQFIALGGRRVDSADGYRNQDAVGSAVRAAVASGAVTREELFVQTKIGSYLPVIRTRAQRSLAHIASRKLTPAPHPCVYPHPTKDGLRRDLEPDGHHPQDNGPDVHRPHHGAKKLFWLRPE